MRRVAVIGSGVAGLAAAWRLAPKCRLTLLEAGTYFGGHAHTVELSLDGIAHGVDTGFLVMNERTYPQMLGLLAQLDVAVAPSDMSFSVQVAESALEWSGSNLDTVFAQRANLVRPKFWRMLRDILRFNRRCSALAAAGSEVALDEAIGDFLDRERYSRAFRAGYLLPMIG